MHTCTCRSQQASRDSFLVHCRDPKAFLEGLLERYTQAMQRGTPSAALGSPTKPGGAGSAALPQPPGDAGDAIGGGADLPLLLSAAAVALLQAQPGLAEHAVVLGYVGETLFRCLKMGKDACMKGKRVAAHCPCLHSPTACPCDSPRRQPLRVCPCAEKLVRLLVARAPPLPPGGLTADLLEGAPLLPGEAALHMYRTSYSCALEPLSSVVSSLLSYQIAERGVLCGFQRLFFASSPPASLPLWCMPAARRPCLTAARAHLDCLSPVQTT